MLSPASVLTDQRSRRKLPLWYIVLAPSDLSSRALYFLCNREAVGDWCRQEGWLTSSVCLFSGVCPVYKTGVMGDWILLYYSPVPLPWKKFCFCFKGHLKFPLIAIPVLSFQVRNVYSRKWYIIWLCSLCKNYFLLLLAFPSFVTKSVEIHILTLFILEVDYNKFIWLHCPQSCLPEVTLIKYCVNLCKNVNRKAKIIS